VELTFTESQPQKRCRTCKVWFPASTEHFYSAKRGKYKLQGQCKECDKASSAERQSDKRRGRPDYVGMDAPEFLDKVAEGREMVGRFCGYCMGLPHRRARPKCRGCKEPHQVEVLVCSIRDGSIIG
jgi:hypothetical protein